jgi:hypothetical protein
MPQQVKQRIESVFSWNLHSTDRREVLTCEQTQKGVLRSAQNREMGWTEMR